MLPSPKSLDTAVGTAIVPSARKNFIVEFQAPPETDICSKVIESTPLTLFLKLICGVRFTKKSLLLLG